MLFKCSAILLYLFQNILCLGNVVINIVIMSGLTSKDSSKIILIFFEINYYFNGFCST